MAPPTAQHAPGSTWRDHAAEYTIEAIALGTFMVSASIVSVVLEHPASPVRQAIPLADVRRVLAGLAMGLTLVAIVYSRPGRQSGAHMNPVLTLTFLRLGKIAPADALGYVVAQFTGAAAAMAAVVALAGRFVADPSVNYVRTVPGPGGPVTAILAEAAISFGMMLLVLTVSNSRWRAFTGLAAGTLVATYISLEAPLSGMSMNPARSLGPAAVSGMFTWIWIYFVAPLAGMLGAAELFVRLRGRSAIACAKLHHDSRARCIFRCGWVPDAGIHPASLPPAEARAVIHS